MFTCPRARLKRFHVGIHDFAHEFRLTLEGPFTSAETTEVENRWRTAASIIGGRPFEIDLTGVTSADGAARDFLRRMYSHGALLVADSAQARTIAGEIIGRHFRETAPEPGRLVRLRRNLTAFLACLALRLKALQA